MMDWLSLLLPAWIMGTLLVFLTAPLGCLMLWRRMSFFADTMAHGTLLGVAIAGALSLPLWMGVTFLALLLVGILWILHDPRLPKPTAGKVLADKKLKFSYVPQKSAGRLLLNGFLVNMSNPKAIVFLLAVLPQFLDLSKPQWIQYLIMAATMITIDLIVMAGYTGLAAKVLRLLKSPRQQQSSS